MEADLYFNFMKNNFQPAKDVVRKYYAAFDTASNDLINV
jgi:hypothetical protein